MWVSEDAIIKHFVSVRLIRVTAIHIMVLVAITFIHLLHEIFINITIGIIFCQVIRMKLLIHDTDFLTFSTQFCMGNIPILQAIEVSNIATTGGLSTASSEDPLTLR